MISRLKELPWDSVPKFIQRIIIITLVLFKVTNFTLFFAISAYWWTLGIILVSLICLIILISGSQIGFLASLLLGLGTYILLSWLALYISFWVWKKRTGPS